MFYTKSAAYAKDNRDKERVEQGGSIAVRFSGAVNCAVSLAGEVNAAAPYGSRAYKTKPSAV
jgi:hypothetical protein